MLIFKLCNFIRGYVVINLKTKDYEKTLNLLRRKNINIWDIEKSDAGIKFKILYEDYKKYIELLNEQNFELLNKKGVAFKYKALKIRKGFIAGIVMLLLCFFVFTSMVFSIEVVGADNDLSKEIINILQENNISMPHISSSLNDKQIELILHKNLDNLKFVEAYIEGSKLIIFVKEKEKDNTVIKDNEPSSIVSSKNAIINKIITKSGQTVVREGDVVYEGQTLVMGIIKNKNSEEFVMVPSDGTIYGKTYYKFDLKEEKIKDMTVSTNKNKKSYYFKIKDKNIKIIGDTKPFENYNYSEKEIKVPIISKLINTSLVIGKYYEEKQEKINIDEKTAQNKMKVKLYDDLIKMCSNDSKILNTSFNFQEDENNYYLDAQIEVIEDIGKKVKIYPTNENTSDEKMENTTEQN
jgi:similar to stage IV sporulation protein